MEGATISFFDYAYEGTPPWDIGKPQPEFVRLSKSEEVNGAILDLGCGTGENSLYFAGLGHEVWGVDSSLRAIHKAKAKARKRGVKVTFLVHDALQLKSLHHVFDSAIDSGLFHVFADEDRPLFVSSLSSVLRPGGAYYMICFSEKEPADWGGPRRVTQGEIRDTFRIGWRVNYIREAKFETNLHGIGARAWLSSITRL